MPVQKHRAAWAWAGFDTLQDGPWPSAVSSTWVPRKLSNRSPILERIGHPTEEGALVWHLRARHTLLRTSECHTYVVRDLATTMVRATLIQGPTRLQHSTHGDTVTGPDRATMVMALFMYSVS